LAATQAAAQEVPEQELEVAEDELQQAPEVQEEAVEEEAQEQEEAAEEESQEQQEAPQEESQEQQEAPQEESQEQEEAPQDAPEAQEITVMDDPEIDFALDEEEALSFDQVAAPDFGNPLDLSMGDFNLELTLDDILTMTDNNELVILGDSGDSVSFKDGVDGQNWVKSDAIIIEDGHTFDVYHNGDITVKIDQDINDTIV
jgi:hypothetical protein